MFHPFNTPEFEWTIRWVKVIATCVNTCLLIYTFDKHIPKYFKTFYKPASWQVYKSIIHLVCLMITINTLNHIIVQVIGDHGQTSPSYWEMMAFGFGFMIFVGPIILAWNYISMRDNPDDYQVYIKGSTQISPGIAQANLQKDNANYKAVTSKERAIWMAGIVFVIVDFILLVYEPFNVGLIQSEFRALLLLGVGLVAGVVVYISQHVVPQLFKSIYRRYSWSGWLNAIHFSSALSIAGLLIGIYMNLVFPDDPSISTVGETMRYTIMMGIFPGLALLAIDYILYLREALNYERNNLTTQLNTKNNPLLSSDESEVQTSFYGIKKQDIILCSAMGNYMRMYYRASDDTVSTKIIRSTLTDVYANFEVPYIMKCHRSHMVNMNCITQYSGNAKGMKLKLEGLDTPVHVSRVYTSLVKSWIQSNVNDAYHPEKVADIIEV